MKRWVLALLIPAIPAWAAPIACPTSFPEYNVPGFEMQPSNARSGAPLRGARLFEGAPGEERADAPAELAPDAQPNGLPMWKLAGGGPFLLVCVYGGTVSYLRAVVPADAGSCRVERRGGTVTAGCR